MATIPKLPRETSSRRLWVSGFSRSTFHPWQFDIFWNPKRIVRFYTFISKNRHEQDWKEIFLFCIFFPFCFAILKLYVCFQYSIFLKIFYISWLRNSTSVSVAGKKTLIFKSVEIKREIPSLVYLIVLAFWLCGLWRLVVFLFQFFLHNSEQYLSLIFRKRQIYFLAFWDLVLEVHYFFFFFRSILSSLFINCKTFIKIGKIESLPCWNSFMSYKVIEWLRLFFMADLLLKSFQSFKAWYTYDIQFEEGWGEQGKIEMLLDVPIDSGVRQ